MRTEYVLCFNREGMPARYWVASILSTLVQLNKTIAVPAASDNVDSVSFLSLRSSSTVRNPYYIFLPLPISRMNRGNVWEKRTEMQKLIPVLQHEETLWICVRDCRFCLFVLVCLTIHGANKSCTLTCHYHVLIYSVFSEPLSGVMRLLWIRDKIWWCQITCML